MKLLPSTKSIFIASVIVLLCNASVPAFAASSFTITCRNTYQYSGLLAIAIQEQVLSSIDATKFTKATAVVRLRLIKPTNTPVEVSGAAALAGIQIVADPHATGLAFSVQGNADLRNSGQCVYKYVVSITTRGTDLSTNLLFTTSTESTLQVVAPADGNYKRHLL